MQDKILNPEDKAPVNSKPELQDVAHPRHIRSFVRRAGRLTVGQAKAMQGAAASFLLPFENKILDLNALKLGAAPAVSTGEIAQNDVEKQAFLPLSKPFERVVMEIGFGMGEASAQIAKNLPETLFLACEVHEPGVGALLKRIDEQGIQNIRILNADAVQVLAQMIAPGSLDGIHIFFPDPWHKKRHNKRRLIQTPFVKTLVQHLKPGGYLHCATDWQPYAQQMLEVLGAEAALKNRAIQVDGYSEKPSYRPLTKFENRGLKLGHGVWDLVFERQPSSV